MIQRQLLVQCFNRYFQRPPMRLKVLFSSSCCIPSSSYVATKCTSAWSASGVGAAMIFSPIQLACWLHCDADFLLKCWQPGPVCVAMM